MIQVVLWSSFPSLVVFEVYSFSHVYCFCWSVQFIIPQVACWFVTVSINSSLQPSFTHPSIHPPIHAVLHLVLLATPLSCLLHPEVLWCFTVIIINPSSHSSNASTHPSTHLHLFMHFSIHPRSLSSIHLPSVHPFTPSSTCPSTHPSIHPSVHPYPHPSSTFPPILSLPLYVRSSTLYSFFQAFCIDLALYSCMKIIIHSVIHSFDTFFHSHHYLLMNSITSPVVQSVIGSFQW